MLEMLLDMKYNYSLFSNTDYSNTPIDRHITVNLSDRKIKAKYNEVAACIYEKDFQLIVSGLRVCVHAREGGRDNHQ
mgnify:CR=1 FL=1